jgi:hypothetical protein
MSFPETKYDINEEGEPINGRPSIELYIDQFPHYSAMTKNSDKSGKSAVRFGLPTTGRHILEASNIWVVGDGWGLVQVFTQGIIPGRFEGSENSRSLGNQLWKLFATEEFGYDDPPKYESTRIMKASFGNQLDQLPMTYIEPLVKRGRGLESYRKYEFELGYGAMLNVLANMSDTAQDRLEITYHSEDESWEPLKVTDIYQVGGIWHFTDIGTPKRTEDG